MTSDSNSARQSASLVWTITFIDLITLLLTFFVLLFSMTTTESKKWFEFSASVVSRFGADASPGTAQSGSTESPLNLAERAGLDLDYLAGLLTAQLAQDETLRSAVVHRLADRVVVSLPSDLLFASNSADLLAPARKALFVLGGVLANLKNRIQVQGHTDPNPIRAGAFPSNWELSLARAGAVADLVRQSGYERPMVIEGFADGRSGDVAPELPQARRYALARRVDVVIAGTRP
jgi:chemotaxis protein MotB